jgi:hypothetical protein
MKIWNNLKQPPESALKTIEGGRLKGMTDVNPQWRYQAMTEQFGLCGIGWKYDIERLWIEEAGDQVCAFAHIKLYIADDGEWGYPIPGVGGSMMVAKEKAGLHVSDECYKMAITDALSVAMKMIGVASDIYMGLWDGSKYKERPKPKTKEMTKEESKEILKLGESVTMTDAETIRFVKWVASENGVDPRSAELVNLVLPEENFNTQFAKYQKANINAVMT